ncbi:hypothetical protein DPMN_103784 [Dreissena polymorpha]|uniref:Uncharacterized protein n=1 Tax=Dreissena polymorpha TaxID=45954 RepID=A0A9D4JZH3_DREPO|nr:hypothetical protein DPMN_103784 [Dreissena polymorpha]
MAPIVLVVFEGTRRLVGCTSQNGTYTFWEWPSREIRIIDTVTEWHLYLLGMALQGNMCSHTATGVHKQSQAHNYS